MKLLFVADPLEIFKSYKDSTFAMMREAARRGHELRACEPKDVMWQRDGRVSAPLRSFTLTGDKYAWFKQEGEVSAAALADVDAVIMRKDPPFDSEYFYATHLLEQAEREGARVYNSPRALRDHPEKVAILEFPEFIRPTLVTRSAAGDGAALPDRDREGRQAHPRDRRQTGAAFAGPHPAGQRDPRQPRGRRQ